MVRVGNVVEAHQFNGAEGAWQKIGEVVDAVGNNRKQLHNGLEYDYVFDIDIGDGANLKLPYNVSGVMITYFSSLLINDSFV
jgi:phospholipase A-2-activating protein